MPEMSAYVAYTRDLYGVQVGIHPSDEFANLDNLVIAQPGYDAKIMITPSVLVADPNVKLSHNSRWRKDINLILFLGSLSKSVTEKMFVRRRGEIFFLII